MHCKVGENTHHLLTRTCRHCGRPRSREIFLIGALSCDCTTFEEFVGPMAKYDNAVAIDGRKLELGGRPVYIDSNRLLYQMKG